ncbi:uncharacterized protein LOC142776416 [Rhipicephalus microplus]|uniref:uncharacterized protein LOC142776416 n=1 Tax=Rhipicephalus microplus TaxID=6941 RepID=UPI003F6AD1F3
MQQVQGQPQCYGDAVRSSVFSPPVRTFHSEWTPLPTWAASSPADLCFLAEAPWQAAAVPSDRSFPRYYYEDGSGPVSEQALNPESSSEASKPSRAEFLSVVLRIAFARLLLGIRLPIVHNSLTPYDVTPDVAYGAFEQRLEIAPNTVGQRFNPRGFVHPDVDEKGNRRTMTSARTRVRVAGRATKGSTARLLLTRVMTSPVLTPPVTAATTGAQEEDDVQLRRAITLESYSGHVYTHCGLPKHKFYCSAYRKACVLAATDPVHVCNRGSKWFSSIKSCLASCVNGRHVSDRCCGSTLSFPCTWQDVLDVPWYFDGKKCVAWSFPQGTCLSVGRRGVYRNWEECRRRCVLRPESECDETPRRVHLAS